MDQSPQRSTFVTVVAWIFLVLSGFTLFVSVMQNIMVQFLFPPEMLERAAAQDGMDGMPAGARFVFEYFRLVILLPLLAAGGTFLASLGLLRRREWARRVFVVLMSVGALLYLAGIVLQGAMMPDFSQFPQPEGAPDFRSFVVVIRIFSAIMGLGIAGLLGWIAKRLMGWEIRREFQLPS